MGGGDQTVDYYIELVDQGTGASFGKKSGSLELDKDAKHETMTFEQAQVGSFAASLVAGHTYQLNTHVHVNIDNGAYAWGPIDCWMNGTLNNAYIEFQQDQ
jgi:hypothetical protein